MSLPPSIYGKIMDEVFTTVESIGIDRTCQILQDAKAKSLMLSDDTIDFFLEITCNQVGITKDVLLYGNERNDERKMALSLSIYFIKEELKYSYKQLKMVFNKDVRYNKNAVEVLNIFLGKSHVLLEGKIQDPLQVLDTL